MYCQNCGSENKDGAKFCRQCGSELLGTEFSESSKGNAIPAKPKKKAKKSIVVSSIVAVLVVVLTIVGFTVDFKKIALNDFEYYLYLEKKNAEEFVGEDFARLTENFDSFSAESTLTGSMSGGALNYDYNSELYQLAAVLEKSSLLLQTDYNGVDVLNLDADWIKKGGSSVLDLIITVLNGDVIVASDSITSNTYSLSKTLGNKVNVSETKSALKNLLLAVYEHFGEFEEYIMVASTTYDGTKATKMTFDFHYVFVKELTEFVVDYWINDEVLMGLTEQFFVYINLLEGDDLYEMIREEGYTDFKEAFKDEFYDDIKNGWWIDDKLEVKYEVIFNSKNQIQKRELVLTEAADDISVTIQCESTVEKSSKKTLNVKGFNNYGDNEDILYLESSSGAIVASIYLDEDTHWNLSCSYDDDSFDLSFYGRDNEYWCGSQYNYYTDSYDYKRDTLILELDLKTVLSKYDYAPKESIAEKSKALKDTEIEGLLTTIAKSISYSFENEIYGMTD